jgi:hypothetical protein
VDLYLLVLDVQAEMVADTLILVGHPDERKQGDQVAPPIVVEQSEAGQDEKSRGDVVAETVFAGE